MTHGALLLSTNQALEDEPQTSSAELVSRAQCGDHRAFEELMARYDRRAYATARRLLGPSDEVADVVQQVFLKLYQQLERLDPTRDPWPYLCRMTINQAFDVREKTARAGRWTVSDDGEADRAPSPAPGPAERAVSSERARLLRRSLAQLPEKERLAVALRDLEGLETGEVARALGSSATTVRSQISRARLKLRKILIRAGEVGR